MKYINKFLIFFLFLICITFCIFPIWLVSSFGNVEVESIIFHIFMPLRFNPIDWKLVVVTSIALILLISLLLLILKFLIHHFLLKKFNIRISLKYIYLVLTIFFIFDITYIDTHFHIKKYIQNQIESSDFIENNYIPPQNVSITFPDNKRNLIFIVVESLETSLQDNKNGGFFDVNYIPELTDIAKENISFSHTDQLDGAVVLPETTWTIGGLVAMTAGLPLKSYRVNKVEDVAGNEFGMYQSFLEGVITLGNILDKEGYKNFLFLGSDSAFAGKELYFKNHGNYTIYDNHDIYKNDSSTPFQKEPWIGFFYYDTDLYDFAKSKIPEIAKNNQHFAIILETLDTHKIGYLHPDCTQKYPEQIANVYACASLQLNNFIDWLKKQDFYKNTTVIIIGDHCNMYPYFFKEDFNHETGFYQGTKRKIYNAFLNSSILPIQEKNRQFSTMDMFPTILASLGAKIEGERLGLGTNLFSSQKTLPEQYGYDYLFQELLKKSNYYNKYLLYPQK